MQYVQRPICPISPTYNIDHYNIEGRDCDYRHNFFDWRARIEGKGTIIADSLLKWVMNTAYMDVQAIPGLRMDSALASMQSGRLQIQGYEFLIFAVGTNSVHNMNMHQLGSYLRSIIAFINNVSPYCTIGIASILPRPQDNMVWDTYRRQVNYTFKQITQGPGQGRVSFLKTWTCVEDKNELPRLNLYANDRLHFNDSGILRLKNHLEGAFGHLMDMKYRYE
jgi:hypothetical protein